MLILTQEEIVEVTGYKWKNKQKLELARMKCRFHVNGAGKIIVLRHDLFGSEEEKEENREEPNLDWI